MSETHPHVDSEAAAEVPEADRLEQSEPVEPEAADELPERPFIGVEVPEADALEQAREVPLDEEEER
jgi:hypothetical protein